MQDDAGVDEIRIEDVLAWEARLQLVGEYSPKGRSATVTWAVAARTRPPALPALRGGEIVLLPAAVLAGQGVPFQQLLGELAQQRVAAVVVDAAHVPEAIPSASSMPVLSLRGAQVGVEFESELNRLLTEHRGENYRLGTELGRQLSTLTAGGAGLQQVLDVASQIIDLPVFVTDRTGIVLAASDGAKAGLDTVRFDSATAGPDVIEHPLRGAGRLWLGPVPADRRAVARVAADRTATAVEAALTGANWFRSHGPERATSLTRFVLTVARCEPSDARVRAVALGLDPAATFRVALSPRSDALQSLARRFGPLGNVRELSDIMGLCATLIELKRGPAEERSFELGSTLSPEAADCWVAQSAAVTGLAELTEAARQAAYVASLLSGGLIRRQSVRFDQATELGAFRLLYRFWGSSELDAFANGILGDLVAHDRNDVLQQTLLYFLETGGSRVAAAERAAIHRNTLAYRLRRIAELTALDPNEPDDRLALHLALLARALPRPTGLLDAE